MVEHSDKTVRRVRLVLANVGCIVWVLGLWFGPPEALVYWLVLGALLIAAAFAAPGRWLRRLAGVLRPPR